MTMDTVEQYLIKEGLIDVEPNGRKTIDAAHYTPTYLINAAREVMGGIDTDPCSSIVGQNRIKAKVYYDARTNGLEQSWHGRIMMNPSYGYLDKFIHKLLEECKTGHATEYVVHTPTMETWEPWFHTLLKLSDVVCFLDNKIKWHPAWKGFEKEYAALGFNCEKFKSYESHGSMYSYYGDNKEKFIEVFGKFGTIINMGDMK